MPFANGHMVKGTELKRRSKEAKKGRNKERRNKETKGELLCFSESGLRKGGRIQSHLAMTKRLHSGTQGRCDCPC